MRSRRLWLGVAILLTLLVAATIGFGFRRFLLADTPGAASQLVPPPDQSASELADASQAALSRKTFLPAVSALSGDSLAGSEAVRKNAELARANLDGAQPPSAPANPPVPGQGGTCISGYIIDRYHRRTGTGWRVTVTSGDGVSYEQNADGNGYFQFGDLQAGTWTVELNIPAGFQPVTSASFQVTLTGTGGSCANVRFKVEALACIEVTKLDARGQMGFAEIGIPGWQMTARHDDTSLTEVTDWRGKCRFENLVPGTWTVEEESKTGWELAPGQTRSRTIELESPRTPGACESLTFVNQQVHGASIYVRKVDTSGRPLAGWWMTLKRFDGTHPAVSKLTDSSGYAIFDGLALGDWIVQEEVKDWWRPTGPTEQTVTLTERGSYETVIFENEALGCIDGYKINQLNQGLAGWMIVASNDGEEHTAVTNDQGYFQIKLPLGSWTVSETVQTGWEPVTPPVLDVEVTQPFVCEHIRFKNETSFACLDVFKQDAADGAGLPDWQITVQPAYGGTPITDLTDGTGHVRFNGLVPGTYIVSEQMMDGWLPVTNSSRQVTLEATGLCEVITFRNRQATEPPVDPPADDCRAYHKVCWGDTLASIARRYGTTVAALKKANGLYYDTIYAGQTLCIP